MAESGEFQTKIGEFSFGYITHNQNLLILLILFSSVFLLMTFFLVHLLSRFNHVTIAAATTTTVMFNHTDDQVVRVGMDVGSISRMAVVSHGSLGIPNIEERECSICLGLFEDDEMVKVLPDCLHAYHSDCVDKWLSTRSSCPLCRSSIDSIDSIVSLD